MLSSLIITFRETLEIALVVGILLAYLQKTKNRQHNKMVWYGVAAGIGLSFILAWIFTKYLGGFEGKYEQIYEGIVMIMAAGLITWMIFWMITQKHKIKKNIEEKAEAHLKNDHPSGLFLIAFISVAREGIETVIFLQAAMIQTDKQNVLFGGILGIIIAILLGYLFYKGIEKISLQKFFTATEILLIFFAAGLFAHSIHEFQEAAILPIYIEHLWDINGIINEKGTFGEILKGLFGYNGNPSLLEVSGYFLYLILIIIGWKRIEKGKKVS